jgi:HAD superfamily hydrolase (TIGR01509 family)
MSFSGIIFDFNGTLFWDTPLHNQAWDTFIRENNLKKLTDEEKNQKMHGKTNQEILPMLLGRELTPGELQMLTHRKETIYQELCLQQKMELAPGAIPFFDFLKERGIAFTIATSSGIGNLRFYFEHFRLSRWFEFDQVVYSDGTLKSKPDPQIFEAAIAKIHKNPNEVVIFEDSFAGILAAQSANPGKIIIVDSVHENYSRWNYQIINHFGEVDRNIFG